MEARKCLNPDLLVLILQSFALICTVFEQTFIMPMNGVVDVTRGGDLSPLTITKAPLVSLESQRVKVEGGGNSINCPAVVVLIHSF